MKLRFQFAAPIDKNYCLYYGELCPGEIIELAKLDAVKQVGLVD